jgi:hypothetical protein
MASHALFPPETATRLLFPAYAKNQCLQHRFLHFANRKLHRFSEK